MKLPEAKRGFVLLPRRWVVERSFAWATRFRRLAKDYERLPQTVAGLHHLVFACLMLFKTFGGSASHALERPRLLSVAFSSWSDLAVTSAGGHFRGRRVGRADLEAYVRDASPSRNVVRVSLNKDAAVDPAEIVQFFRGLGFPAVEIIGPDGELQIDGK